MVISIFGIQHINADDTLKVINNTPIELGVGFFYKSGEMIEKAREPQKVLANGTVDFSFPARGGFTKQRYIFATAYPDIVTAVKFPYETFEGIEKAVGMTVLPIGRTGITSGYSKAKTVTITIRDASRPGDIKPLKLEAGN